MISVMSIFLVVACVRELSDPAAWPASESRAFRRAGREGRRSWGRNGDADSKTRWSSAWLRYLQAQLWRIPMYSCSSLGDSAFSVRRDFTYNVRYDSQHSCACAGEASSCSATRRWHFHCTATWLAAVQQVDVRSLDRSRLVRCVASSFVTNRGRSCVRRMKQNS